MEKLDDLGSFPSPVYVVPEICRGDSLHHTQQVSQMIYCCYQTCCGVSQPDQRSSYKGLGLWTARTTLSLR